MEWAQPCVREHTVLDIQQERKQEGHMRKLASSFSNIEKHHILFLHFSIFIIKTKYLLPSLYKKLTFGCTDLFQEIIHVI